MTLQLRNRTYHLRKRVPQRFKAIEQRNEITVSLRTDSETIARQKASLTWDNMIDAWEARLRGESEIAETRFQAARDIADTRGFSFLPASQVAELPIEKLLDRIEQVGRVKLPFYLF